MLYEFTALVITIGDVSGKGIPAALYMGTVLTVLRVALGQQRTLRGAMEAANDLLFANNDEAMFATVFCAVIDVRDGAGAACNWAILRRSSCAEAEAAIASHP